MRVIIGRYSKLGTSDGNEGDGDDGGPEGSGTIYSKGEEAIS